MVLHMQVLLALERIEHIEDLTFEANYLFFHVRTSASASALFTDKMLIFFAATNDVGNELVFGRFEFPGPAQGHENGYRQYVI